MSSANTSTLGKWADGAATNGTPLGMLWRATITRPSAESQRASAPMAAKRAEIAMIRTDATVTGVARPAADRRRRAIALGPLSAGVRRDAMSNPLTMRASRLAGRGLRAYAVRTS